MRASIYNAMPLAGVQALVDFLKDFAQRQTSDMAEADDPAHCWRCATASTRSTANC
jgi:hypothetical protein